MGILQKIPALILPVDILLITNRITVTNSIGK